MNKYHTQIFELHDEPGGKCTSWKRKGYTIDGCLHWLAGSSPAANFYHIWEELGAVQGRSMLDHEEFMRVEGDGGQVFIVYTDIDRLEQHMKELAPADREVIEEFIGGIRTCARFDLPIAETPESHGPIGGHKPLFQVLPLLRVMNKWKRISVRDFARRFSDPFLREAFPLIFDDLPDFPMVDMLILLAWMHQKAAGYPVGGSLEFSRAIERRYRDLGGEIHYRSPVSKILVENGQAIGVRLADGTEHHGDVIISAADGHSTIFDMLEGKYIDDEIRGYYDSLPLSPPLVHVVLGVARSFNGLPHSITFPLKEPLIVAGQEQKWVSLDIFNFDHTLAPPGKTVLRIMFTSDYDYWKKLRGDSARYQAEKERIADELISILDQRFPGLASQVEMHDVATPMTWERYTGNRQSGFDGWLVTTKTFGMRMSKTLPGLENFYMAGQWVEPGGGGVPIVAMSGRNVIQIICEQDKKSFVTSIP